MLRVIPDTGVVADTEGYCWHWVLLHTGGCCWHWGLLQTLEVVADTGSYC